MKVFILKLACCELLYIVCKHCTVLHKIFEKKQKQKMKNKLLKNDETTVVLLCNSDMENILVLTKIVYT